MQGSSSKFMSWHGHNFIEEASLAGVYKSGRWNKNWGLFPAETCESRAERDTDADFEITWRDLNSTRVQHTSLASEFTASTTTPVRTKNRIWTATPLRDDYWSSPGHVKLSQICEWLTCWDSYLTPCVLEQISSATQCRRVGEAKLCVWE